jgi:hypothetical protein
MVGDSCHLDAIATDYRPAIQLGAEWVFSSISNRHIARARFLRLIFAMLIGFPLSRTGPGDALHCRSHPLAGHSEKALLNPLVLGQTSQPAALSRILLIYCHDTSLYLDSRPQA